MTDLSALSDSELTRLAAEKVLRVRISHEQAWQPLTRETDAFMLVDALERGGLRFTLSSSPLASTTGPMWWHAGFGLDQEQWIGESHVNRCRAIALAALKAVGE